MLGQRVSDKEQSILLPGSGVNTTKHSYKPYPSEDKGVRILSVLRIMKDKGIEEFLYAATEYRMSLMRSLSLLADMKKRPDRNMNLRSRD